MSTIQCQNEQSRMQQCYDVFWVTSSSAEYLYSYCCEEIGGGNPGGGGSPSTPVLIDSFSGFPSAPIDNQTAVCIDADGYPVEFTYSGDMGVWLMPELQILKETGNTFTIPGAPPSFDPGHILTSIALPAALEPTLTGEAVWTGTAIVLGIVYVYNFAQWISKKAAADRELLCQSYNVPCINANAGYECGVCYQFCITNGYWRTEICPVSSTQQ